MQGYCRDVKLLNEQQQGWSGDWIKYAISLPKFSWDSSSGASSFNGCGSSIGSGSVDTIIVKNNRNFNQDICLDNVKMY